MASNTEGVKVVLVGESQTGKTSIINRLILEEFNENEATTMVASTVKKEFSYDNGQQITLAIWDTAGQEKYRSLNKIFYKDASIAVLVYSINNRKSFDELKGYWFQEIKKYCIGNPSTYLILI